MSIETRQVRVDIDGSIAEVVLNRPDKLKALDGAAMATLRSIFEKPRGSSGKSGPCCSAPGRYCRTSYGDLGFTSLTKEAMPVIRYRTRDLTKLLPGTARPMRRIEKITGRTDDMIILRSVNLFPTQIEEFILRVPSLSPHFQCHLARPGRMDQMTVRVERRSGIDALVGEQGGAPLSKLVKNRIGVTVAVDDGRSGITAGDMSREEQLDLPPGAGCDDTGMSA